MRPIKFRAWDKVNNEFIYATNVYTNKGGFYLMIGLEGDIYDRPVDPEGYNPITDRFILQQFTSLLDKNGKEIYEGDRVSVISDHNNGWLGEICYEGDRFGISSDVEWEGIIDVRSIEVIGHIYQTTPD